MFTCAHSTITTQYYLCSADRNQPQSNCLCCKSRTTLPATLCTTKAIGQLERHLDWFLNRHCPVQWLPIGQQPGCKWPSTWPNAHVKHNQHNARPLQSTTDTLQNTTILMMVRNPPPRVAFTLCKLMPGLPKHGAQCYCVQRPCSGTHHVGNIKASTPLSVHSFAHSHP